MTQPLRLGVLFGGKSGEHEVSLMSAASIITALADGPFTVAPILIQKNGSWVAGPDSLRSLPASDALARHPAVVQTPLPLAPSRLTPLAALKEDLHLDAVFPVLHGTLGEDGTVQGLLELADIPYVGSGVLASAVAMDKIMMKTVFAHHGLTQVPYIGLSRAAWRQSPAETIDSVETRLGYPTFVKPANLGSSVGISKAKTRSELVAALDLAASYDTRLIVERGIDARELEVGVLGLDNPRVSVVGEVTPHREFYDYEAKYQEGGASLTIPAEIPGPVADRIQEMARTAFAALDCAGLARIDFFLERDTHTVYINEVNTLPGFTPFSMYPLLWQHSGVPYSDLLRILVELAIKRHRERADNRLDRPRS